MNITVWGINYAPELTGIAPYNTALCEHFAAKGHAVTMLTTFPYYPAWKKRTEDRGKLFENEKRNSVSIWRCWHYVPAKVTVLKRIAHEFSFVFFSFLRILFLPRPDLMVVVSPPLLLGLAAWIVGIFKRCPYVFHIQDMQPDAAVSLGMIRNRGLIAALYLLESLAYRGARAVTCISPKMQALVETKTDSSKVKLFPNGVRIPLDIPTASGKFREAHQIPSQHLLFVYSGNFGIKQGLPVLLEASAFLIDQPITLVLCGDGAFRPSIEAYYRQHPNPNVRVLPIQPEVEYYIMLGDADVCLVCQASGSGDYFLPSKLLTMLAVGKPILAVTDPESYLAERVKENGLGWTVAPDNPAALFEAMQGLLKQQHDFAGKGQNGRAFVAPLEMGRVQDDFESQCVSLING